jgi:hypothetical protein
MKVVAAQMNVAQAVDAFDEAGNLARAEDRAAMSRLVEDFGTGAATIAADGRTASPQGATIISA